MVGPKILTEDSQGIRYHARERVQPDGTVKWLFEEVPATMAMTQRILVRLVIAKVENVSSLAYELRKVPIRQGQPGWNCVSWVKEALAKLQASQGILGTGIVAWRAVRDGAMGYCQKKKDQGRFRDSALFDGSRVPTFDLIEEKEMIP